MSWLCYIRGMNIHCEWKNQNCLVVKSCGTVVALVEGTGHGDEDPVLTIKSLNNPSLTRSELDHIWDNWDNMPRP